MWWFPSKSICQKSSESVFMNCWRSPPPHLSDFWPFNDIPKSIPGGSHIYMISCKVSYAWHFMVFTIYISHIAFYSFVVVLSYSMHFTVYISQYAFNSMHFSVCILQYAFHSLHFKIYILLYAFHSVPFTVCILEYVFYRMHLPVFISHFAFHSM